MWLFPQYNQEIHYVEPCLNGTLVRADKNNKDVSARQADGSAQIDAPKISCVLYPPAFQGTSGQAVCQGDRPAGRGSGRSLRHPQ